METLLTQEDITDMKDLLDLDQEERAERRRQKEEEVEKRREAEIEEEDERTKEIHQVTNIRSEEDMEQGKCEQEEENVDTGGITNGKRMREGSQKQETYLCQSTSQNTLVKYDISVTDRTVFC